MTFILCFALSAAVSTGVSATESEPNWPGGRSTLASLRDHTVSAVVGVAKGKVEVRERHAAHMSTAMARGDGTVIRGGGIVVYAEGRQKFQVSAALSGKAEPGDRVLDYDFVEKAQGFPLPRPEKPIPDGAQAILLLDEKGSILKAMRDTPWNRKAVRDALAKKDDPKK